MSSPRGKGLMEQDGDFASRYVNNWCALYGLFYFWANKDTEHFARFLRVWLEASHIYRCSFCQMIERAKQEAKTCPVCGGDGVVGMDQDQQCRRCQGVGMVRRLP